MALACPAAAQEPGETFSDALGDGGQGPEMVVVPAGSFEMGCVSGEECYDDFHYDLRSAVRFTHAPEERNSSLGFRVARAIEN